MSMSPKYNHRLVMNDELENLLVLYLRERIQALSGVRILEFRQKAFQIAEKNNLKMPDAWRKNCVAGKICDNWAVESLLILGRC